MKHRIRPLPDTRVRRVASDGQSASADDPRRLRSAAFGYCRSITEKDVASGPSGDFRVRRGASLNASGNRHAIFVEEGASAVVTGQSSVVYVAKGGQATVGGKRNQVFAEPGGRVMILGQASIATVSELDLKVNRNAEDCQ